MALKNKLKNNRRREASRSNSSTPQLRNSSFSFDPDALDHRNWWFIEHILPVLEWFNSRYFRFKHEGIGNIPNGPAIFVGNHNGGIFGPDFMCTLPMLWRRLGPEKPFYPMAHDFAMMQFTPLGRALQMMGAVRASRRNAERVIRAGGRVLVYPGGDIEAYRSSRRRNEIIILPRTGFIDVARDMGVPIIPIVAHGAHRSALIFSEGRRIARLLRLEKWARLKRFPLALALPWGVALGPWLPYLPLPFPIRVRVLPAVRVTRKESVEKAAERVQRLMQAALDEMAGK
jgi:1-acyl-sn-glycerol-3-phosphate acyltransferase